MLNFKRDDKKKKTIPIGECDHGDVVMDISGDVVVVMHVGLNNCAYDDDRVWVVSPTDPCHLVYYHCNDHVTPMPHLTSTMTVS